MSARRPLNGAASRLNFRPSGPEKNDIKGTKPLRDRSSVLDVLLVMLLQLCRRFLFIDARKRVLYYLAITFFVSIVTDFIPAPKVAVARKESFFNNYFVKLGWGWTLLVSIPFVTVTSFVYCCGRRPLILIHSARILVATVFWYLVTHSFNIIENLYGRCNVRDSLMQTKSACLSKGYFWSSLDVSGHVFILIYSTLVLIEECRVIDGWDGLADLIRDEDHKRLEDDKSPNTNPLRSLSISDLNHLANSYPKLTPYIRVNFIAITCLALLWEIMLITTTIFYHSMVEKFVAALFAIASWFLTYQLWYPVEGIPPPSPGRGLFKYNGIKSLNNPPPPNVSRRIRNPTVS